MKVIQNDAETRNRLAAAGPVRAADYEEDLVVKEFHQIIDEFMPADAAIENSMQMNETQKRQ
jgi:hypothetical protein